VILVADSSALITLARIGRFQLLRAIASVVLLDAMLASGFFLDTTNYRSILQRAGE
jgi:predicted nucleic acid-binding protein